MMHRIRILLSIVIAICLPALLPAQQSQIATVPVEGPVYMIQGSGAGNIGIFANASGVVAIDAMMANSSEAVQLCYQNFAWRQIPSAF